MRRFEPTSTKVVFFDLEYYVPISSRNRKTQSGMYFSPLATGHKIIGGHFQVYFPMTDTLGDSAGVWEWSQGSEREVLRAIFELLGGRSNRGRVHVLNRYWMLCGIGISHSDVPALLAKMTQHKIEGPTRIYDLICGSRQIDLSVATYCQFSPTLPYFRYPKTKADLYKKYLGKTKPPSGKRVWEMYDSQKYTEIETRCAEEVAAIGQIYKAMFDLKTRTDDSLSRSRTANSSVNPQGPTESGG